MTAPEAESLSALEEHLELLRTTLEDEQRVTVLCDEYVRGDQTDPYSADEYTEEYRELVARAKTNIIRIPPIVIAQVSAVAGYRRMEDTGEDGETASKAFPQEWKDLKRQRLGITEKPIYNAAATYGQAFVEVYKDMLGRPKYRLLSSVNTVAIFDHPSSDEFPIAVYETLREPSDKLEGQALGWDAEAKYDIRTNDKGEWEIVDIFPHDLEVTPVVRFPCFLDSEGRVSGLVEHLIPGQDRVNQSVLDLLTGQAYTGSQVYTASGVKGEPVFDPDGNAVIDENTGEQAVRPLQVSSRRVLTSDDPGAKFGTLGAGDLRSLIESLGNALEIFAITGQMSPYIFHQGSFDNISADALAAVDAQFLRLVGMLHDQWAECWSSVLRLFAQINGEQDGAEAYDSELRWADKTIKPFASYADGIAKLRELNIPDRGLWQMVPGVTSSVIQQWEELRDEDDAYGLDPDDPAGYDSEIRQSTTRSSREVSVDE